MANERYNLMAEEKTVTGFIKSMNTTKTNIEIDMIKQALELAQSKPYDPVSEILDLVFAVTDFGQADIPGGEAYVAGQCLAKLVRYLTLRAKPEKPTNESGIPEALQDFVREAVRLFAEVQANRGVKIVEKRS